jgi:hypothetical protein
MTTFGLLGILELGGGEATDPELIWHWTVLPLLLQNLPDLLSLVT